MFSGKLGKVGIREGVDDLGQLGNVQANVFSFFAYFHTFQPTNTTLYEISGYKCSLGLFSIVDPAVVCRHSARCTMDVHREVT